MLETVPEICVARAQNVTCEFDVEPCHEEGDPSADSDLPRPRQLPSLRLIRAAILPQPAFRTRCHLCGQQACGWLHFVSARRGPTCITK